MNLNPVITNARKLESVISDHLIAITEQHHRRNQTGVFATPVFELYQHVVKTAKEVGIIVTSQFFNRTVSDMAKAGVVVIYGKHNTVSISQPAFDAYLKEWRDWDISELMKEAQAIESKSGKCWFIVLHDDYPHLCEGAKDLQRVMKEYGGIPFATISEINGQRKGLINDVQGVDIENAEPFNRILEKTLRNWDGVVAQKASDKAGV